MVVIRAVIADDSALLREALTDVLHKQGEIRVIAAAQNGKEAIEFVKAHKPDILILDCEMPVMNGLEALKKIMEDCPLPVFMFSSLTREGAAVTIKALELGAVDFLTKPTGGMHQLEAVTVELIRKVKFIVLKSKFSTLSKTLNKKPEKTVKEVPVNQLPRLNVDVIAIGSSTGGVQAGLEVIPKLPKNIQPIVWVQHMPPNFTKSYAERLSTLSQIEVREGKDGDILKPGVCYLAPGGFQMRVCKRSRDVALSVGGEDKVGGHCPSCNVLFNSVAQHYTNNALGVILTGMGSDGTDGLTQMHEKGAYVIGQNPESCVVYGMPKAAFDAGAVDVQLDIKLISEGIKHITGVY